MCVNKDDMCKRNERGGGGEKTDDHENVDDPGKQIHLFFRAVQPCNDNRILQAI